ncbi:MAG: tetraacyldisaccharide 4'-kinase, partial [bacterium]|nr:tetraacyldisaccharide 4'-kinase [bacterium]
RQRQMCIRDSSGGRNDRLARVARVVLAGGAAVYGVVTRLRASLYKRGILRRSWPGCLVISVGNITVGGTGKTPVVETFARALARGGRKVAIISRGYKARSPSWRWRWRNWQWGRGPKVVHDGRRLLLGAREAGDEPYMLARNLENVVVIIDPDRVRGSRFAIREFGVDTIILDDGMQHLRLQRQLEIVLIDATCPFGYEHLLPRGLLRESLRGLRRATHIFITKARDIDVGPIIARVRTYNATAEIIACYYEPVTLVNVHTGEAVPLEELQQRNVFVVTGIAEPGGFVSLVKELGATVVQVMTFPDHHRFRRTEIEEIYGSAGQLSADAIVITEKDSVRFPRRAGSTRRPCPVYYVKVAIKIKSGEEDFLDCIARICYP